MTIQRFETITLSCHNYFWPLLYAYLTPDERIRLCSDPTIRQNINLSIITAFAQALLDPHQIPDPPDLLAFTHPQPTEVPTP